MKHDTLLNSLPKLPQCDFEKLREQAAERGVFILKGVTPKTAAIYRPIWHAGLAGSTQPIYIIIDSEGGDVIPAWKLVNAIRHYPGPTIGVVMNEVGSSAMLILQACKLRLALPGSHGLVHSTSQEIYIEAYNQANVKHTQDQAVIATDEMLDFLSKRTGVSRKKLIALSKLDDSFNLNNTPFIDGVIEYIPPWHPLPKKWCKKLELEGIEK
jgi:ATP-dependent protease ClpP protease subunit